MKKNILQFALLAISVFFAYKIYASVSEPIKFQEEKIKRYAKVITNLKMIRDAQEACKVITGTYAADFASLISFVDNAKYTITQQRDTSWIEYDKVYRIDVLRQGVVIDTLGYTSVKDSLFKGSDSYKRMMEIPDSNNGEKIKMEISSVAKAGYNIPVFVAKVPKASLLWDQPDYLVKQEQEIIGVDDIDGPDIRVGSLEEVSTTGNWPSLYDSGKR